MEVNVSKAESRPQTKERMEGRKMAVTYGKSLGRSVEDIALDCMLAGDAL